MFTDFIDNLIIVLNEEVEAGMLDKAEVLEILAETSEEIARIIEHTRKPNQYRF